MTQASVILGLPGHNGPNGMFAPQILCSLSEPYKDGCIEPENWRDIPSDIQNSLDGDLGTKLTVTSALSLRKHLMICDPNNIKNVDKVVEWIQGHGVRTLNVGGPSEFTEPGIGPKVEHFLLKVFARLRG